MTNSFHMSWKYWSVIDYEKTKISDVRCFDWIKLIDWYRLVNIDWLTDIDRLSGLACWPQSVRMKTLWEDLVNKGSNFADFIRFCPHTYTHTQQFLPPLMGDNEILLKEKYLSHHFARLIVFMCAFCHTCLKISWKVHVLCHTGHSHIQPVITPTCSLLPHLSCIFHLPHIFLKDACDLLTKLL